VAITKAGLDGTGRDQLAIALDIVREVAPDVVEVEVAVPRLRLTAW
jgi:hypothetical protein